MVWLGWFKLFTSTVNMRTILFIAEGGQGDDAFDKRLAALKSAKKQVPYGKSRREEESAAGEAHHPLVSIVLASLNE